MANARFSTNGTVWSTVTINQTLDASGGTSFISSRLNSGIINNFAYVDGIWGAVTDNGVILKSMVDVDNFGTFNTIYNRQLISWTTVANPIVNMTNLVYGQGIWVISSGTQILTSTNTINWTTRTSNFGNTAINKITYGQGIWVAVGKATLNTGQIRSSTDAVTWVTRTSNLTEVGTLSTTLGATYGNGVWVIVTGAGQVRSSTNAITWTTRNTVTNTNNWGALSYNNGLWFINSNGTESVGGALRTSTDLVTWTTRVIFTGNENGYYPVLWNGTVYGTALSSGGFRASTNGITWVTRATRFNPDPALDTYTTPNGIAYANGIWIMTSTDTLTPRAMQTSTDTITWISTISSVTLNPQSIIFDSLSNSMIALAGGSYAGGIVVSNSSSTVFGSISKLINLNSSTFAIVSSGQLYTSRDLESFTQTAISWTTQSLNNIFLSNGIYIYCFNGGQLQIDNAGSVSQITTGINDNFLSAAQKSGIYNVVGQNAIYRSTNLVNWTTISNAPSNAQSFNTTSTAVTWTTRNASFGTTESRAIAYGGPVVGSSTGWLNGGIAGQLRQSTDAITWSTVTFNFATTQIRAISYGDQWVVGGYSNQMRTSTNAVTWVTREPSFGTNPILALAYNNGLWLAVGGGVSAAPMASRSTNGVTWVTVETNSSSFTAFNSIAYGNNVWVIAGSSGTVRSSTDTISWTTITTGYTPTYRAIAYANGIWILTGNTSGIPGALQPVRSTDLITWTTVSMGWNNSSFSYDPGPRQIAYANGLWVAGGQPDAAIYTSTDTITWTSRTNFSSFRGTTINGIAYGNGVWVGVGGYNTLPLSLTVTSPQIISNRPITDIIAV